jgi:PAS domain S-box-containing protein
MPIPLSLPQRSSIRRKVVLGFGFVLLLLVTIGVITWRSTRGFMETAEIVSQTRSAFELEEKVLRHVMEMESDRRGFLLTGDERHLVGYVQANGAILEGFNALKDVTREAPNQARRLARLKELLFRSFALQRQQIEARRTGGFAAAAAAFANAESESATKEIRQLLAEFSQDERVLLAERVDRTQLLGRWTTLVIVAGTLLAVAGMVAAGHLILRDIAARRRADEALADQHNLLSSIIDTMPDHVFVKDVKGRYIMNNRAHRQYLGLAEGDGIEGKTVHDFFPPSLARLYDRGDQQVLETGKALRNSEEPGRPIGPVRWLSTTKVPLREASGRILGLVCVSSDITERKDAEEKLRRFAAQLERSNAELQNFASVASHDLQEPLRKIQAFGDRLKVKCSEGLGELGRDYLDRMQNAAQRMQTLIQDLLKLSRVTSRAQPFERCDLAEIVSAVLSDLEVAIEQSGASVDVQPLPTIAADPVQMRQLFQNLIANALKFHVPGEAPRVSISGRIFTPDGTAPGAGGQLCEITVQDHGIGFEEQFADQIFVVFQRLHSRSEYEGTGIGLAVCRKITDRHGGSIVAKSTAGHGATFIVTLPVDQIANEAHEEHHADHHFDGR